MADQSSHHPRSSPSGLAARTADGLLHKIRTRRAVVSVIGLGYVGLPLAVAFAEAGFRVVGIDLACPPGRVVKL